MQLFAIADSFTSQQHFGADLLHLPFFITTNMKSSECFLKLSQEGTLLRTPNQTTHAQPVVFSCLWRTEQKASSTYTVVVFENYPDFTEIS